jgi:hypothetical protein
VHEKGGNVPALLLDKEHSYVIVGRRILLKVQLNGLPEAVVAFLAAFYLLDAGLKLPGRYGGGGGGGCDTDTPLQSQESWTGWENYRNLSGGISGDMRKIQPNVMTAQ